MPRKRRIVLAAVCIGFNLLCLCAADFVFTAKGIFWLALTDYTLYRVFAISPRKRRTRP